MSKSATLTILLITRDGLLRGDLAQGKTVSVVGVWKQPRPDLPDLAPVVEMALDLGPRPARKVVVLTTDLWTQTLEMPLHKSKDLGPAELLSALNFEAEALSGLSAFESMVSQIPLGTQEGFRTHWLVQARSVDVDLIADVVRKAGSKLVGVGHPGGLPQPLTPSANARRTWQRIELWPDAVVALRGQAQGPLDLQVFNSDPKLGRWRTDAQDWERRSEPADDKDLLVATGSDGDAPAQIEGLHVTWLSHPESLASWLAACGEHLTRRRPEVPLLVPAPVPLSVGKRRAIAALGALVALALCSGYHWWLDRGIQAANLERAQLQEPAKRLAQLEKQLKETDARAGKLKDEAGKFQRCADKLIAQRKRLARLLQCLARNDAADLLVQKIDNDSGELCIEGMCLQPELADQFAAWLTRELRSAKGQLDGWEVKTPEKEAKNLVASGGPWHFRITCSIPVDPQTKTAADPHAARTQRLR